MSKTLREILGGYASYTHVPKGLETSADLSLEEAEQQILQWVADEVIGEDVVPESIKYNEGTSEDEYVISQNELRSEERVILREHGWKEPK